MSPRPQRHLNLVALTLFVDVHVIDSELPSSIELRRLWDAGWIALARTDVLDTELAECRDPVKRQMLEDLSASYPESHGPLVFDHSRWDHAVFGSDEDAGRLDKVYNILFPGVVDRAEASGNHHRDAMHVATAIRYAGYAFVTTEKRLLNKDPAIREAFGGFRIWHPDAALAEAMDRLRGMRALHAQEQERGLPSYPPD